MRKLLKNSLFTCLITTLTMSTTMTVFASQMNKEPDEIGEIEEISSIEQTETLTIGGAEIYINEVDENNIFENVEKLIDPKVTSELDSLGLEYYTENGIIKLTNPTEENISKFNNYKSNKISTRATYPTGWTNMPQYSIGRSKKFTKASKSAFATTLGLWLKTQTSSWESLAATAAISYGTYYFLNTDVEDVYTFINYKYRELGVGKFDSWGNYMGNYEIHKFERVTKSSNNTGGQTKTSTQKSTIITPTF